MTPNERDRDEVLIVDALGPVYADKVKRILTTDDKLYYSKAGNWVAVSDGGGGSSVERDIVIPVNADFAWVNQGTATITDNTETLTLRAIGRDAAADDIKLRKMATPSAPWTLTAKLLAPPLVKSVVNWGLCFRESSSGKLATLTWQLNTDPQIRSLKFTSPTAFSAAYTADTRFDAPPKWFRLQDDNSNRIVSVSETGKESDWLVIHSVGRTDFLTADEVGFYAEAINAATPNLDVIVTLASWEFT